MRAGRLKQRIKIEIKVTSTGTDGSVGESWKIVADKVGAHIEPAEGSESSAAGGEQGVTTHKIIIRYKSGIKRAMRIVYKKRIFDIQSIVDIREENRELHLMCREYDD